MGANMQNKTTKVLQMAGGNEKMECPFSTSAGLFCIYWEIAGQRHSVWCANRIASVRLYSKIARLKPDTQLWHFPPGLQGFLVRGRV